MCVCMYVCMYVIMLNMNGIYNSCIFLIPLYSEVEFN